MASKQTQDINLNLTRNEWGKPDGKLQSAVLTIETDKHYNGGLDATATVFWFGDHSRSHAFGLGGGGDFSKTLAVNKTARATQKAIDTLHAQTFTPEVIASLTAEAIAYYVDGKDSTSGKPNPTLTHAGFKCESCGREESACSADPCEAVIADRAA